jgi:hypothetical protein
MEQAIRIEATMSRVRGDARPLASHWADKIRKAVKPDGTFADPELEKEYQEWKRERDRKKGVQ